MLYTPSYTARLFGDSPRASPVRCEDRHTRRLGGAWTTDPRSLVLPVRHGAVSQTQTPRGSIAKSEACFDRDDSFLANVSLTDGDPQLFELCVGTT